MFLNLDPNDIANVILHVILIATFIGIFFFTYASRVEQEIVEAQVNYLVKDFTQTIVAVPETNRKMVRTALNTIQPPDMKAQDEMVENYNKELIGKATTVLTTMVVIGALGVFLLYKYYDIDIKTLLIHNAIVLCAVGLVEFSFLNYIARNFISADANRTKRKLIETIKHIK